MYSVENQQIPLGTPIPGDTPHAVSVSLPTMADVEAFGEQDPHTFSQLQTCYPRFGVHPFVREATSHFAAGTAAEQTTVVVNTPRSAIALVSACALRQAEIVEAGPLSVVRYPKSPLKAARIGNYLQATGGVASSRRAEDYLASVGERASVYPETMHPDNPEQHITTKLAALYPNRSLDIRLSNSGMSSIYALAEGLQAARPNRNRWVTWGTTYSDTIDCLETAGGTVHDFPNMLDRNALSEFLEHHGQEVAGILTEAPNNPLLQTANLEQLAELAARYDLPLVVDVSVAGSATVDVSPYADVIVESLTKFASGQGDMMMGALLFNRGSRHYFTLVEACAPYIDTPYIRDLARMAHEIDGYRDRVQKIGRNTLELVDYLAAQPEIATVRWADAETQPNVQRIQRYADQPTGVITIEPADKLGPLYDALAVAKGPSFGIENIALHTPYMYLTHFAELAMPEARQQLMDAGLNPEMLRISVSAQDAELQKDTYERAFVQLRAS